MIRSVYLGLLLTAGFIKASSATSSGYITVQGAMEGLGTILDKSSSCGIGGGFSFSTPQRSGNIYVTDCAITFEGTCVGGDYHGKHVQQVLHIGDQQYDLTKYAAGASIPAADISSALTYQSGFVMPDISQHCGENSQAAISHSTFTGKFSCDANVSEDIDVIIQDLKYHHFCDKFSSPKYRSGTGWSGSNTCKANKGRPTPKPRTPKPTAPQCTSATTHPATLTPTTQKATTKPPTAAPTTQKLTAAPTTTKATVAPTTTKITAAPTTQKATTKPATVAPTTTKVTAAPTTQKQTAAPTTTKATAAPTTTKATAAPTTQATAAPTTQATAAPTTPATAAPTTAGPTTAASQQQCAPLKYTQNVALNGNEITATFTPLAGEAIPLWVNFGITKDCYGNPTPSTGECAVPWVQYPWFDAAWALNLHATSAVGEFETEGSTYANGVFSFVFPLPSGLSATDALCYDFTWAYGDQSCNTGICSIAPPTVAPTLPAVCDNLQYTQNVAIQGTALTATFTPAAGQALPVWVDFHISKDCAGNPTPSNGVCATPWVQYPWFDADWALNMHATTTAAAFQTPGASYANGIYTYVITLGNGLSATDALCYDFTWAYGDESCNTNTCSIAPANIQQGSANKLFGASSAFNKLKHMLSNAQ